MKDCSDCKYAALSLGVEPCVSCINDSGFVPKEIWHVPDGSHFEPSQEQHDTLRSRLALAEALIETIENVYPDICDMAQYREWKEAGR